MHNCPHAYQPALHTCLLMKLPPTCFPIYPFQQADLYTLHSQQSCAFPQKIICLLPAVSLCIWLANLPSNLPAYLHATFLLAACQHACPPTYLPVCHRRSSSNKCRIPSKAVFHKRVSSIQGCLPTKDVFNQRMSSIKHCLPSKVVFHLRLSSIKDPIWVKL